MNWDVKLSDKIEYFDPDLSYEITKYIPINDKSGLDFNPDWFREDAIHKLSTGNYSGFPAGSRAQREFWQSRLGRCTNGYESHGYRISGDNYFWLNFYRLKTSIEGKKAGAGRQLGFPKFLVFQYEYFHYVEMCEILKKDVALLKARALGFSEMGACLCARPFVTTPNYRVLASAYSEKHLKPLLAKVWSQLDWLNEETEGGFKRLRMVINTNTHKRASLKKKDGTEIGHMAEIEGTVADSPEKIRGDRTERIFFEEAGSDKVLKEKYLQAEALITVLGGDRVGTRILWGTGGDKGASVEGIKDIVTKPDTYNILKFCNRYTIDGKPEYTGMFIPAFRSVKELWDNRGYTDPVKGKAWYEELRLRQAHDPKALLIFKAEYCFTIEEALIQQGDNMFPREELAEQSAQIEIYKTTPKIHSGHLIWTRDENDRPTGVKWKESADGKIKLIEHPLISEESPEGFTNLYVAGIDSIDIGTGDSSGTDKNPSEFCIVIKKRVFGLENPKYVAIYKDRPRDPREAYEIAAKMLTYYGCQAVLESTRTAILTYFRDKKWTHLLMRRPRSTMSDVSKGNAKMYGTPASIKVIEHYRELIYDFCLDYSSTIAFGDMVTQLLQYSDEKKKDFDIVAAMGMCELGDEEMSVKKPEAREKIAKEFRDIGWYKDSKGYRHYGVIPKTEEERNDSTRIRKQDSWLYDDLE